MSRARHGVIDRVYRDGTLVAERHRYDNRLTMAVLSRLDRLAEGMGENAPVIRAVAQEFDRFLDVLPEGVDGAEEFVAARFPAPRASGAPAAPPEEPPSLHGDRPAPDTELARLARCAAYERYGVGLPAEIDLDELCPSAMESWTDEQWDRAEFSGLLPTLAECEWPQAAREPHISSPALAGEGDQPQAGGGEGAQRPNCTCEEGGSDSNGRCKLRQLYLLHHPPKPEPESAPEEDFAGCEVWEEGDGDWRTNFPPPEGFDGYEEGEPGDDEYWRELTAEELEAIGADAETVEAGRAERLAAERAARDLYFGFDAGAAAG